jgi:uncharacterized protein YggU (UPF0235/DUF167 family)
MALDVLGEALGVAPSSLEILSGESSQDKTVLVPLGPEEVRARLAALDAPRG